MTPTTRLTALLLLSGCCLTGCIPPGAAPSTVRPDPVDQRPAEFTPKRQSSTTMAVWLGAWEDQRGDLHAPSTVYIEVDPTKWTYGDASAPSRTTVLRPLQIEARPAAVTTAGDASGGLPAAMHLPLPAGLPAVLPTGAGRRGA
jgi:hypothetical protein